MKNKKKIIALIYVFVFVVLISGTMMTSHAYYYRSTSKMLLFDGNINPGYAFRIDNIFVEGNEVDDMGNIPANYVLDDTESFCYVSNINTPDGNVELYTNARGEHVIDNFVNGEKCELHFISLGPTGYWYAVDGTHTFPSYGGALRTTGAATNHNVYVGQNSRQYFICDSVSGNEICIGGTYEQFNLEGHTPGVEFTAEEQTNAMNAVSQKLSSLGLTPQHIDKNANSISYYFYGNGGVDRFGVFYNGEMTFSDAATGKSCSIYSDSTAICGPLYYPLYYWFGDCNGDYCTLPANGGTAQSNGTDTGYNVYIGQDSNKYYLCFEHHNDICLAQPYTQYGLTNHTAGNNFTAAEQASGKAGIVQAFNDFGVVIDINNCTSNSSAIYCEFGQMKLTIRNNGMMQIFRNSPAHMCNLKNDGTAMCSYQGGTID